MGFRNFFKFTKDVAEDDSDKVITVPDGENWELLGIYVKLTTTATVGDRQLEIQVITPTGILLRLVFEETQAASLTKRYAAALGLVSEVHVVGEMIFVRLPLFHLRSGDTIRVFDSADVDATADDMEVQINHISHSNS